MSNKTWKAAERRIAEYWPGAERRGADYRTGRTNQGKNDIIAEGWSIEVKHGKRHYWSKIVDAVEQAERSRENDGDIPVAVLHKTHDRYDDSLVVMRLETFAEFFI